MSIPKLVKQSDYVVPDIEKLINDVFDGIKMITNKEITELTYPKISDYILIIRDARISYYGKDPKPLPAQSYESLYKLEKDLRNLRSLMLVRDLKKVTK